MAIVTPRLLSPLLLQVILLSRVRILDRSAISIEILTGQNR